ncbi:hypothetical protein YC2023_104284 [Brassica napus]
MRHSFSESSLKPVDPEEELRWMSQEVRGYVEAVLNSRAANVPKAVVLCQVEKAKEEDMLNQLYSSISAIGNERIESLIQEPVEVLLQGMTGEMPSTALLMERQIHCQGTDQVLTAAATAIMLRMEKPNHQAMV